MFIFIIQALPIHLFVEIQQETFTYSLIHYTSIIYYIHILYHCGRIQRMNSSGMVYPTHLLLWVGRRVSI